MTHEFLTALFQDNIFQYGLAFGFPMGFVIGFIFHMLDTHCWSKLIKRKENKDK